MPPPSVREPVASCLSRWGGEGQCSAVVVGFAKVRHKPLLPSRRLRETRRATSLSEGGTSGSLFEGAVPARTLGLRESFLPPPRWGRGGAALRRHRPVSRKFVINRSFRHGACGKRAVPPPSVREALLAPSLRELSQCAHWGGEGYL